jgi:hypothetical protein
MITHGEAIHLWITSPALHLNEQPNGYYNGHQLGWQSYWDKFAGDIHRSVK